ncbi:response regulator transcription factor [Leptolyngbya sp. FACHB-541]|uniref:response regulator transcription factor n=1 Tax=Leptolyngbya sp. FACHB-541 TaxID=2692810 RepID=UPI0016860023|nr:response regulator transcription factor [Leptolyngbya sp. FACHB-541]MBD1867091.1 response regulator transcription factor [Cyanobacteria bacterium FACHB-471]MBD1997725.1 response regulator transcription factor [Leptolyngbya sp. FACHB-541]
MTSSPIRILVAEDHAVVRDGLVAILNREADMTVVAEAEDGQQAVELYDLHQPDLTLMDLRMPNLDGVEAIAQIRATASQAKIIVLTTYDTDEDIYRGLQAGARGYLLKDTTSEELLQSIHTVHQGQRYVPSNIALKLSDRLGATALTQREQQVIQLLVNGKGNADIMSALNISEGTVKFHINNILNKLNVSDRTQAVIVALKRGLARLNP